MVTAAHEGPIQIIRDNPEVIAQILHSAFAIEIPDDLIIKTTSEEFTQIAPTAYRADNVVEMYAADSSTPTVAVIAETQRRKDQAKRGSWPVYLTGLHQRTTCPCYLVVFCEKRSVAEWARLPIEIGQPGFTLVPSSSARAPDPSSPPPIRPRGRPNSPSSVPWPTSHHPPGRPWRSPTRPSPPSTTRATRTPTCTLTL